MAREDGSLPMVSYWGIWNDGPEKEIPPGMIGAQAIVLAAANAAAPAMKGSAN